MLMLLNISQITATTWYNCIVWSILQHFTYNRCTSFTDFPCNHNQSHNYYNFPFRSSTNNQLALIHLLIYLICVQQCTMQISPRQITNWPSALQTAHFDEWVWDAKLFEREMDSISCWTMLSETVTMAVMKWWWNRIVIEFFLLVGFSVGRSLTAFFCQWSRFERHPLSFFCIVIVESTFGILCQQIEMGRRN